MVLEGLGPLQAEWWLSTEHSTKKFTVVVVGERDCIWVHYGHSRGNCTCWDALGLWVTRANAKGFSKAAMSSSVHKGNCHLQYLTLFWNRKAATAPPPHEEEGGQPGGACFYVFVRTCNSTLPVYNFCSTLLLPRAHQIQTEVAWEIMAIVSFICCLGSSLYVIIHLVC
jgi:hypothetical protein